MYLFIKNIIFVLSIRLGGLTLMTTSILGLHNNINRIKSRPVLHTSLIDAVFYCAKMLKYTPIKLINPIYLPLKLVREAIAHNWLDSLIYFVWLRKCYQRPIIYNYTTRKVASL